MKQILRSAERGHAAHGWLDSFHTFSFADYYNPDRMGFRSLRVINEDRIDGGTGFPKHPHRDMEIVTYMIEGAIEHRDSLGSHSVLRAGEVQRMTAGKGIQHSEINHSATDAAHLLQIWILPEQEGLQPSYEQKSFASALEKSNSILTVSSDGRNGSLKIHQDMDLWLVRTKPQEDFSFEIQKDRSLWIQVISGEVEFNDSTLKAGDAGIVVKEDRLKLRGREDSQMLLFDLS